jgi:threonine dehydratase
MGWEQRTGTTKSTHDYENEEGWNLFFEDSPPRWVVAGHGTITIESNEDLSRDQIEEAQAWGDGAIAEYLKNHPRPTLGL